MTDQYQQPAAQPPQWGPFAPDGSQYPQGVPVAAHAVQYAPSDHAPKRRAWFRTGWVVAPVCLITGGVLGAAGASGGGAGTVASAPSVTVTQTVTAAAVAGKAPVSKPAPVKAAVAAPAAKAAAAITDDGTYTVGVDIAPGTYKAPGGDACYWARLKNTSGDVGSILANNLGGGRQVVTIKKGDAAFETRGCGTWTR